MDTRSIQVYNNDILAGVLRELPNGWYSFRYDDAYYSNSQMPEISVSLPKTQNEYISEWILPFFTNMLPEGSNRKIICQRYDIEENDLFGILLALRGVDFIGAINLR